MTYPTLELVEKAGLYDLARWQIHLDSPGMSAIGKPDAEDVRIREHEVLLRIMARVEELGGITPTISKSLTR